MTPIDRKKFDLEVALTSVSAIELEKQRKIHLQLLSMVRKYEQCVAQLKEQAPHLSVYEFRFKLKKVCEVHERQMGSPSRDKRYDILKYKVPMPLKPDPAFRGYTHPSIRYTVRIRDYTSMTQHLKSFTIINLLPMGKFDHERALANIPKLIDNVIFCLKDIYSRFHMFNIPLQTMYRFYMLLRTLMTLECFALIMPELIKFDVLELFQ